MKKRRITLFGILMLAFALSLSQIAFAADSTSIKVQYNGNDVAFTDASPKFINDRTMVPLRQILETMGAEVSYDQNTQRVLAKTSKLELSFIAGETDINITEEGKTIVEKMDVPSFLDENSGRMYVPARFIAESMGYVVGWDNKAETVVIIDPVTLFADADKDFSIISKLLTSDLDPAKAYENTGKFNVDLTVYESPMAGSFSISGNMKGITQNYDMEELINLATKVDLSYIMPENQQSQITPKLQVLLKDVIIIMKIDGETGVVYMNLNTFSQMDSAFDNNTWFKFNIFDVLDHMDTNLKPIMNLTKANNSVSEILRYIFVSMGNYDVSTYRDTQMAYVFMKNLVGDDTFKKQNKAGISTYTLDIDPDAIISALAKMALAEEITFDLDPADLGRMKDDLNDADFMANIVVRERKGILYGYKWRASMSVEGNNILLDMSGDRFNSIREITVDMKDTMKMGIRVDYKLSETNKTPNVALPKGTSIIDVNNLTDYLSI